MKITSQSSSADILSYNFTLSSKKNNYEKVYDDENESPNKRLYSNTDDDINDIKSIKTSADVLTYALSLSSKKKKISNDFDLNDNIVNETNDIISNLDNDYYSNDNDNYNDNSIPTVDEEADTETNASTKDDVVPTRAELHHLLKDKVASALEFELIDLLNKGEHESLLELKGIGKKYAQNILDLRYSSSPSLLYYYYHYHSLLSSL